jgi:predicted metal-dependent phosphoesterase TrpH
MFSGDSTTTLDEIVESIVASGIDVLCVTDHNAINGAQKLQKVLEAEDICRVIIGEEVRTHSGEIIGLFLSDRVPFGEPALATADAIRRQGGLVYIPHPFDPLRKNLHEDSLIELADAGFIDAIEVFNAKTSLQSLNRKAATFASERDLAAGAGSDAHVPLALGSAYVEMPDFDGPTEFLRKLADAVVDKARPWSARIVPSTSSGD